LLSVFKKHFKKITISFELQQSIRRFSDIKKVIILVFVENKSYICGTVLCRQRQDTDSHYKLL